MIVVSKENFALDLREFRERTDERYAMKSDVPTDEQLTKKITDTIEETYEPLTPGDVSNVINRL